MSKLNEKIAIVTGATSGIGYEVAKKLGHDGYTVILNGIDDKKGCLLYTSPSPRDKRQSRMPSSA